METRRRLGCRAHDFGRLALDELSARIADAGFECVQLAPAKAIKDFPLEDGGKMGPAFANRVATAFARRGIGIAVLGCYINPVHPDLALREKALGLFRNHLDVCGDLGCGSVATETGSLNADSSFHVGNAGEGAFATLVAAVGVLAEAALYRGVTVCLEGVVRHVANSPARLARVLEAVASPSLRVILDPVNWLDAGNYGGRDYIVEEACALFGSKIQALHAKDFLPEGDSLRVVAPGKGLLDFVRLFRLLDTASPSADILIEDLKPGEMAVARDFIARSAALPAPSSKGARAGEIVTLDTAFPAEEADTSW